MIKLIATDIDGTIVKDGTMDLNPEYLEVIGKLLDKGIKVVIASGRQVASMKTLFAPLKERLLYISDGGAVVRSDKEIFKVYPLREALWKGMYHSARELKVCDYFIATPHGCFAEDETTYMYDWLKNSYKFPIEQRDCLLDCDEEQVIKFSVFHRTACEEICRKSFIPEWQGKVSMSVAGVEWVDCLSIEANKGNAIRFLQQYLGISPEETCVFGDNLNDIEMLEASKLSYAVGNARDEVKRAAAYVTAPYWEYGALSVLKKIAEE